MTLAETRFTMLNGIVGRLYLSGYLTDMSEEQLSEVRHALRVHKAIRQSLTHAVPFWPLGLPQWQDEIIALGFDCGDTGYLAVWMKKGLHTAESLELTGTSSKYSNAEPLYGSSVHIEWNHPCHQLTVLPTKESHKENPSCILLKLS
jgi:alpha-galactosidase